MSSRKLAQVAVNIRQLESLDLTPKERASLRSLDKLSQGGERAPDGYLQAGEVISGLVLYPRATTRLFRTGLGTTPLHKSLVHIFPWIPSNQQASLLIRLDSAQQTAVLGACDVRDMEGIVWTLAKIASPKFIGMILHQRFAGDAPRVRAFVDRMFRLRYPQDKWEIVQRQVLRKEFVMACGFVDYLNQRQSREAIYYLPEIMSEVSVLHFIQRQQPTQQVSSLRQATAHIGAAYALSTTLKVSGEVIVVPRGPARVAAQTILVGKEVPRPRMKVDIHPVKKGLPDDDVGLFILTSLARQSRGEFIDAMNSSPRPPLNKHVVNGMGAKALDAYDKLLEFDPENIDARFFKASIAHMMEDRENALIIVRDAIARWEGKDAQYFMERPNERNHLELAKNLEIIIVYAIKYKGRGISPPFVRTY